MSTKVNKMDPDSDEFQLEANRLARSFVTIVACRHCGHPVVSGHCCGEPTCPHPDSPTGRHEEESEYVY